MPVITVKLQTAVRRTFRVEQVAGMFDVPLSNAECGVRNAELSTRGQETGKSRRRSRAGRASHPKLCHELVAEVPGLDEEWTIGAIVGPSGSGKTTLARTAFGDAIYRRPKWPRDRALIDCFGDMPVKLLTQALAASGLGSPVAWLKPYRVLSTGEKFRADLFRAFLEGNRGLAQRRADAGQMRSAECGMRSGEQGSVVVVDEFSGALDRTVAKTASAAFSYFLRAQEEPERRLRFVAVTCHEDVLPWLSPDWVVRLGRGAAGRASSSTLVRGRPRKPGFRFRVERAPQMMWWQFEPHHYLSGGLAASASCYAAMWNKEPIGFCAVVAALGWEKSKRIQRLVVLPEFRGWELAGSSWTSWLGWRRRRDFG